MRVLLGTGALLVLATLWVPVAPRSWERVLAVRERADGTRRLVSVVAYGPWVDRDWIWRTSPRATAPLPEGPGARVEVGDRVTRERPVVRTWDMGLHLGFLIILGGLAAIAVDLRARRRRAWESVMPTALPVDDPERPDGAAERAPPRAARRLRRCALFLGAGIGLLAVGGVSARLARPETVECWVTPFDLPRDRSFGPPARVRVWLDRQPTPEPASARPTIDVLAPEGTGPGMRRELQSRLRAALAERCPTARSADLSVYIDGARPCGSVVGVLDAIQDPGLGITWWGVDPEWPVVAAAASARDPAPWVVQGLTLPRVERPERCVVDRGCSIDVHVAPGGAIRIRNLDARKPKLTSLVGLESALRTSARAVPDFFNPQLSSVILLIHADDAATWAEVEPCVLAGAKWGYPNIAFVVEPLAR